MSGPQFLLLYLILVFAANLLLRRHFRHREEGNDVCRLDSQADPYRIAYLRKGADESIRVAVFSLVDRGLLSENAGQLACSRPDAETLARRPLERAILACYRQPGTPQLATYDHAVKAATAEYERSLKEARLLADEAIYARRFPAFALTLGFAIGLAAARILNALAHGRSNIGFLVILTLAGAVGLVIAYRRRLSGRGQAALSRLQRLFSALRQRAPTIAAGGASHEATVLAAVFGLHVLPAATFAFIPRLYPRTQGSDGGSGGGDGSGGCDGGGCGGGGCGGGCGG